MTQLDWRHYAMYGFVLVCLLSSALGIVYVRHATREMFSELNHLQASRDEMNNEWTQLLLEQGTLSTDGRVDTIARNTLRMHQPSGEETVWVRR